MPIKKNRTGIGMPAVPKKRIPLKTRVVPPRRLLPFFESAIKTEIMRAKKSGGIPRELSWIKEAGKLPLSNVERISTADSQMAQFLAFLESKGMAVISRVPKGSNAATTIHTHPERIANFSFEDIMSFLKQVSKSRRLRFDAIVAHDEKGNVAGLTLLHFGGSASDAEKAAKALNLLNNARIKKRKQEIRRNPEKFNHILPGQRIFSREERAIFIRDFFNKHKMVEKFFPSRNHRFNPRTGKYEPIMRTHRRGGR